MRNASRPHPVPLQGPAPSTCAAVPAGGSHRPRPRLLAPPRSAAALAAAPRARRARSAGCSARAARGQLAPECRLSPPLLPRRGRGGCALCGGRPRCPAGPTPGPSPSSRSPPDWGRGQAALSAPAAPPRARPPAPSAALGAAPPPSRVRRLSCSTGQAGRHPHPAWRLLRRRRGAAATPPRGRAQPSGPKHAGAPSAWPTPTCQHQGVQPGASTLALVAPAASLQAAGAPRLGRTPAQRRWGSTALPPLGAAGRRLHASQSATARHRPAARGRALRTTRAVLVALHRPQAHRPPSAHRRRRCRRLAAAGQCSAGPRMCST
mmetsp:Transcript_1850/g.5825  ORF Transcript_1850/g.5825 Transcript_1850/m.5825 type:complete len:321 (-) Transcript_1850:502-1464(-)